MNHKWINTIIGYFVLLVLQIFVFSRLDGISIYMDMQIYVMFILLLPPSFTSLSSLLLSAFMGLSVDIFSSDTIGLHMAACALIAYMRPALLKSMTTPIDLQIEVPMPKKSPFSRYLAYTVILIFIHHLALFSLETFNISEIAYILTKTLVSAAASLAMITLFELVVVRFSR